MAPKLTKKAISLLKDVAESTATENVGMLLVQADDKDLAKLFKAGFVELNPNGPDENGDIACRATEAGLSEVGVAVAASAAPVSVSTSAYELETGIAVPKVSRGGRGRSLYPFDAMEVGMSFHVPVTDEKPNPAKALASVVSAAKKRYKDEEGNLTRNFVVRRVDATDPKGPGARVFRIELPAE